MDLAGLGQIQRSVILTRTGNDADFENIARH